MSDNSPFKTFSNPIGVPLTPEQVTKARGILFQGRPLLELTRNELLLLLMEANDTLKSMTQHLRGEMHRRPLIVGPHES